MSNEIKRLKRRIKTIEPLKKKNELELNLVQHHLKASLDEYDKTLSIHQDLLGKRDTLVNTMQETYGSSNDISIHEMNNSRYYLHDLDDEIKRARDNLKNKSKKVESLKQTVSKHQIDRNLFDKTQAVSKAALMCEQDKLHMNEMDEMCSRKNSVET